MNMRDLVLGIVRASPGVTGVQIHRLIVNRWHAETWLGQKCQPGGALAAFLEPSSAKMYKALRDLEGDLLVRRMPGVPTRTGGRRYHYFPQVGFAHQMKGMQS
jgi:hypothetical protein